MFSQVIIRLVKQNFKIPAIAYPFPILFEGIVDDDYYSHDYLKKDD
ncbi:MAG: hypothetical protein P8Y18_04205 [Candidatus Bathyarchaeota archaeon]